MSSVGSAPPAVVLVQHLHAEGDTSNLRRSAAMCAPSRALAASLRSLTMRIIRPSNMLIAIDRLVGRCLPGEGAETSPATEAGHHGQG